MSAKQYTPEEMLGATLAQARRHREELAQMNKRLDTRLRIQYEDGVEVWPVGRDWSPIPGSDFTGHHRAVFLDGDILMIEFQLKGGFTMPVHDHVRDGYVIEGILLRSGHVSYRKRWRRIHIQQGQLRHINARKKHSFRAHEDSVGKLLFTKIEERPSTWWQRLGVLFWGR